MGKYFGTDGIRGNANEKLTVDMAFKVGRFIGDYYGKERAARIVIGKDTRLSSGMFETALAAGISASGGNVYLIGYCSTPCLAYLTGSEDFDCGVMISASHNPFHDNGIKLFSKSGLKIQEDIENLIEAYIDHPEGIALKTDEKIGNVYNFSEGLNIYKNWLCGLYKMDLKGMKILLDLANGSNCFTAVDVLRHYGADVSTINDHPDGININTNCGSTHLGMLQEKMREGNYDIGFAFDGDADRVLTVDCHGEVVDGDKAMFALGLFEKANGSLNGNTVVTTVMSNIGLFKALAKHDINIEVTAVGDKNVVDAMVKNDYCIGGEQSGHIINKHQLVGRRLDAGNMHTTCRRLGYACNFQETRCPFDNDVTDVHVAIDRREFVTFHGHTAGKRTDVSARAEHVEMDGCRFEIHTDTLIIEMFPATPAWTTRLEAYADVCTLEHAVMGVDITNHAGRLAAAGDAAMCGQGEIMAQDNIFRRAIDTQTVNPPPGVDCEAVIARREGIILNKHIAARLDVHTVTRRYTHGIDRHATDDDAVAIGRHDVPEDRLLETDPFDEHIAAVYRTNKCRQEDSGAVMAVIDTFRSGLVISNVFVEVAIADVLLQDGTVTLRTDQAAFACESDVALAVSINECTERHALDTCATGEDDGKIILHATTEMQFGTLLQVKIDIALQDDASGVPYAGRYDDRPSSAATRLVDGFLDGDRYQCSLLQFALREREGVVREDRTHQLRHVERSMNGCNGVRHTGGSHLVSRRYHGIGLRSQFHAEGSPQEGNCRK